MSQTSTSISVDEFKSRVASIARISGITPQGASWAMRALHPADVQSEPAGVPKLDCDGSAVLQYQATYDVVAPSGCTTTWDAVVVFSPDPVHFGKVHRLDNAQANWTVPQELKNPVLCGGGTFAEQTVNGYKMLSRNCHSWRLTNASVTSTLVATATTNSGTVAAAQIHPRVCEFQLPSVLTAVAAQPMGTAKLGLPSGALGRLVQVTNPLSDNVQFMFTNLSMQGGALVGEAREGAYSIMKLDDEALNFQSMDKNVVGGLTMIDPLFNATTNGLQISDLYPEGDAGYGGGPYHPWLPAACVLPQGTSYNATGSVNNGNTRVSVAWFRGLHPTASLIVKAVVGIEYLAIPSSIWVPNVRPASPYDPVALDRYFAMTRIMPDALPASYNVLGTIIGAIGKGVRWVGSRLGDYLKPVAAAGLQAADLQLQRQLPRAPMVTGPELSEIKALRREVHNLQVQGRQKDKRKQSNAQKGGQKPKNKRR